MNTYQDWLKEYNSVIKNPDDIRGLLQNVTNRLTQFDSAEVADTKDVLLDLQKVLEDKLTGVQ